MPLLAIDLHASQGDAVLNLLERAEVPPLPAFYRLFYDYVAGVDGLMSSRMHTILSEGSAERRLYAEFVAPYETGPATARALARIVERLQTLQLLIDTTVRASRDESASLRAASLTLAGAPVNTALLREWVQRLTKANDSMRQAQHNLGRELDAAQHEVTETRAELDRWRAGTRVDPLTGLVNRVGLDLELERLLAVQDEAARDLAFAVIDVDHFKSLNDTYGHQLGDEVLRIVSRALLASVRQADIVGRTGGDEFLVVLPATNLEMARDSAERMRIAVRESDLRMALGPEVLGSPTISIGVAQWRPADTVNAIMDRADHALYEAKRLGRNRVVCEADYENEAAA